MINIDYALEALLEKSADEAVSSFAKGDILAYTSLSQGVSFEFDRLHSIEDTSSTNLSARVFEGNRAGAAFVNAPSSWKEAVRSAQESAPFGEDIAFSLPPACACPSLPWNFSPKNCAYTKEQLKDLGSSLVAALKKEAPKAKITVDVSLSYSRSFLRNTEGFRGSEQSSSIGLLGGIFELDAEGSFIELYEGKYFYDDEPDFAPLVQSLIRRREWSLASVPAPSASLPVLFAPSAMGILIDPLLAAANGKTLNKGLSVLCGKEGKELLSSLFNLTDDPLRRHGHSYTFDDEGTPARALSIFEGGVFKNFIHDCASAAKKNTVSTGHGQRGPSSLPAPSFSNVSLKPGLRSFEALLDSIDSGLLLCEGLGEGQSNVLAGDFSILGSGAYLIKNGKITGRVKDLMLSGNAYDALKHIQELSCEEINYGGLFTPYALIEGLSISSSKGV